MHINTLIVIAIHFAADSVIDDILIQIDFDAVSVSSLIINTSVDAVVMYKAFAEEQWAVVIFKAFAEEQLAVFFTA